MKLVLALMLAAAWGKEAAPPYAVLLLAHGGDAQWNHEVEEVGRGLRAKVPVEIAFGMADHAAISQAIRKLEERSPSKIVAVPLFVNSQSEVMDQTRFVLGLRAEPSKTLGDALGARQEAHAGHPGAGAHAHSFSTERVKIRSPFVLTPALDEHPVVLDILAERAKALSKDPSREVVLLVGHGPVDERANRARNRTIGNLCAELRKRGGYRAVRGATLRDDAPPSVRAKAVRDLRELVSRSSLDGRVLVVPYLMARGGIERKVEEALKGLKFTWDATTLMPHPAVARWVEESAAAGSRKEDMRRFR